jgi:hypothetical protein
MDGKTLDGETRETEPPAAAGMQVAAGLQAAAGIQATARIQACMSLPAQFPQKRQIVDTRPSSGR